MKQSEIEAVFGMFKYESKSDGSIKITDDWVKNNIQRLSLDGHVLWTNKLVIPQIKAIYKELKRFNIEDEFDLSHGGGSYVPRRKSWNPKRRLSLHSWGIAIDINPEAYPYGSHDSPPAAVILAFEKHGFIWGGDWRTPDPMHFEWRRFV